MPVIRVNWTAWKVSVHWDSRELWYKLPAMTWQSCYRSEQALQFLSDLPARAADKGSVCTCISYDSSLSWRI